MTTENLYTILLKKKAGLCSPAELSDIDQRLLSDPEARQLWEEIDADIHGVWSNPGTEEAWEQLQVRRVMAPTKKRSSILSISVKIAAAAVVALAVVVITRNWRQSTLTSNQTDTTGSFIQIASGEVFPLGDNAKKTGNAGDGIAAHEINTLLLLPKGTTTARMVVRTGQSYRFILPDSSLAFANSNTTFRFDYSSPGARKITMDGEIYFEIKADPERPLSITTPMAQIDILGTSFNVNTYGSTDQVALITGAVNVKSSTRSVRLLPGTQAVLSKNGEMKISETEIDANEWINGDLHFHDMPLSDVVEQLRNGLSMPIVCNKPAAATMRIAGTFNRNSSISEVAMVLNRYLSDNYKFVLQGDTLVITNK